MGEYISMYILCVDIFISAQISYNATREFFCCNNCIYIFVSMFDIIIIIFDGSIKMGSTWMLIKLVNTHAQPRLKYEEFVLNNLAVLFVRGNDFLPSLLFCYIP